MVFSGENIAEFFDADDFDDIFTATYVPVNDFKVTTKLQLLEMGGELEDGTVAKPFWVAVINRQDVSDPMAGDKFIIGSVVWHVLKIIHLDGSIAKAIVEKES